MVEVCLYKNDSLQVFNSGTGMAVESCSWSLNLLQSLNTEKHKASQKVHTPHIPSRYLQSSSIHSFHILCDIIMYKIDELPFQKCRTCKKLLTLKPVKAKSKQDYT